MKSVTLPVICIMLCMSLASGILPVQSTQTTPISLYETIKTNPVSIISSSEYCTIKLSDATTYTMTPHHPMLPKIVKQYTLPYGSHITEVTFDVLETDEYMLTQPVVPNSEPIPLSEGFQKDTVPTMDIQIYHQTTPYPSQVIEYSVSGALHDQAHVTLLTLTIYPIQYFPLNQKIHQITSAEITIEYTPPEHPITYPSDYNLVIVAPKEFQQPIESLITHKNNYGMISYFKSTEDIYEEYSGNDKAEQIKYFLKDAVESYGINHALLFGNIEKMPMRLASIEVFREEGILTDLYYADLFNADGSFSSWDQNRNGKYCEYSWDLGLIEFVDLYSDISVGRIPCKNVKEAEIMIEKIITYETTAYASEWANRFLVLAGDTFPSNEILEGEIVTGIIANHMQSFGFEPVKLWTSLGTFKPMNINEEISKGAGFICYSGHGYEQGFGTSPPFEEQRVEYLSPYLIGMRNTDKYPVIFFDACSTTKLDFTIEELLEWYPKPLVRLFALLYGVPYQLDAFYPTFSWEIIKKPHGGGVAAIGSTRVAFTGVDEDGPFWGAGYLNDRFFNAYTPGCTLGDLFLEAENAYLSDVGELVTLQEFVLLGDPSLKIGGYP